MARIGMTRKTPDIRPNSPTTLVYLILDASRGKTMRPRAIPNTPRTPCIIVRFRRSRVVLVISGSSPEYGTT